MARQKAIRKRGLNGKWITEIVPFTPDEEIAADARQADARRRVAIEAATGSLDMAIGVSVDALAPGWGAIAEAARLDALIRFFGPPISNNRRAVLLASIVAYRAQKLAEFANPATDVSVIEAYDAASDPQFPT